MRINPGKKQEQNPAKAAPAPVDLQNIGPDIAPEEAQANRIIARLSGVSKRYRMGDTEVNALREANLIIRAGDYLSILGPSGSGKSTLLNILGCLDVPTSGDYTLFGQRINGLGDNELTRIRNKKIGFVFQNAQLLPRLTALENVELPLVYAGVSPAGRREMAMQALRKVFLENRMDHLPTQLSGGQQQRVAIARAIANHPALLLADEPTGALDQETGKQIMGIFDSLNRVGSTVVMITHNEELARTTRRTVRILDGRLTEE